MITLFDPGGEMFPWIKIFIALSLPQFQFFWEKLDFPFSPTIVLQKISHDFSLKYLYITNIDAIEKLPGVGKLFNSLNIEQPLTESARGNRSLLSIKNQAQALFKNSFAELEQVGYGEPVYKWGLETRTYYKINSNYNINSKEKYENINLIEEWMRFLRYWAITYKSGQSVNMLSEWKTLFEFYIPIYEQSSSSINYIESPFSIDLTARLQKIILDHETEKLGIETELNKFLNNPQNPWEEFGTHYIRLWLKFERSYRINQNAWRSILENLSSEERIIFRYWGIKNSEYHPLHDLPHYP